MIKNKGLTERTIPIEDGHKKSAPTNMQYVRLGNSGLKVRKIKAAMAWA